MFSASPILGLWNGLLSIWLRNTNCVTCKQSRDVRMKTSRTSLGWKRPECTRNRKTSKGFMKDVSKRNKTLIYLPYWIKPTRTGTQMNKFASNRPICVKLPKNKTKKVAQMYPKFETNVQMFFNFHIPGRRMSYGLTDYKTLIPRLVNRVRHKVEHFQDQLRMEASRLVI